MILNFDELIFVAGSDDCRSYTVWLEPSLIVHINESDESSRILHGYETYIIMELIEHYKPFVVPPHIKNRISNGKTSFR